MRVLLSVDMEGVTGLTDPEEMHAGKRGYERGCELMTADANAAIDGRVRGGRGRGAGQRRARVDQEPPDRPARPACHA